MPNLRRAVRSCGRRAAPCFLDRAALMLARRLLAFGFACPESRGLGSAADTIALPEPEPRAMGEHFVVPSIGSRDVACAEWSDVRRFEHLLELLDVVNDAFNVHSVSISNISMAPVKRDGISGNHRMLGASSEGTNHVSRRLADRDGSRHA
jgi:hypothetical protein